MSITFNPSITQTAPSGRPYKVVGLSIGHNDKGSCTGNDVVYIRYLDRNCEIKRVEINGNKK